MGLGKGIGGSAEAGAVLVVEDDSSILELVRVTLESAGISVLTANNGREGLDVVSEGRPLSLIVLDMRMPVLDGWAFARELRARGRDVPILVMTAAESARRSASEIAAAGWISKPFDLDDLVAAVERHRGC